MFECSIITESYKYNPIWNSGCQSDPDDYETITLPVKTESNLTVKEVVDPILTVFLEIILKKPDVESMDINTNNVVENWPDEWGAMREVKKLTCKKKSENSSEGLTEMGIKLNSQGECTYTRNGAQIKENDLDINYWKEIKEKFSDFNLNRKINTLCVTIFERILERKE